MTKHDWALLCIVRIMLHLLFDNESGLLFSPTKAGGMNSFTMNEGTKTAKVSTGKINPRGDLCVTLKKNKSLDF
jgi:hypothetical protein